MNADGQGRYGIARVVRALTLAAPVTIGAAAIGPAVVMSSPCPRVEIEALMYSGRPNPTWHLSSDEARELVRRIDVLPTTVAGPPVDGLGYHGLSAIIRSHGPDQRVMIGGGAARTDSGARLDAGHGLEAWLLKTGRKVLGQETLDYLLSSVSDVR